MAHMDEIDQKQQDEINKLQQRDLRHDFWLRLIGVAIVAWVLMSTSMMMVKLTNYNPDCPHPDCVHHEKPAGNYAPIRS